MTENKNGLFYSSITRGNTQIKKDRGIAIAEKAQLVYKRKIEDIEMAIKEIDRDRKSMLDLSPTNAMSLVAASDFSSEDFLKKDIELGIRKRQLEIELEIVQSRHELLFIKPYEIEE